MSNPVALHIRQLSHRIAGTDILRNLDLQVRSGERLAVIGPNGAGKTTLFNLISGRQRPTQGSIALHGQAITGWRPAAIRQQGLARSFQISQLFSNLTVWEHMCCALMRSSHLGYCFWRRLSRQTALNHQAHELLSALHLIAFKDMPAEQLCYADQRALELGLTLAGDACVLLLDEPTAGMSSTESRHMVELIRRHTQGRTLLLIEHDMRVVFDLADRIVVLVDGQVLAIDTPQAIRSHPAVQAAYLGRSPVMEA